MFDEWLLAPVSNLAMIVLSAAVIYVCIIVFTRMAGLRSFSKMSSFDFAMTVAIGSMIATTVTAKDPPLLQGVVALASVYALQKGIGVLRRFEWVSRLVDNQPALLMINGKVLHDNLRRAEVEVSDLRSKLREANVLERSQVRAVVIETTGDISVLHSDDDDVQLEAWLLDGVQDADQFTAKGKVHAPSAEPSAG